MLRPLEVIQLLPPAQPRSAWIILLRVGWETHNPGVGCGAPSLPLPLLVSLLGKVTLEAEGWGE